MALYFENLSGQPVWVAFAFFDPNSCGPANQNFRKQGWWQLDRNPRNPAGFETSILRFNAWNVDLRTVNRYAYFYAETANDGSSWSGTGNSWLSVNPAAGFSQCAFENADDPQWVDFYGLDFRPRRQAMIRWCNCLIGPRRLCRSFRGCPGYRSMRKDVIPIQTLLTLLAYLSLDNTRCNFTAGDLAMLASWRAGTLPRSAGGGPPQRRRGAARPAGSPHAIARFRPKTGSRVSQ